MENSNETLHSIEETEHFLDIAICGHQDDPVDKEQATGSQHAAPRPVAVEPRATRVTMAILPPCNVLVGDI